MALIEITGEPVFGEQVNPKRFFIPIIVGAASLFSYLPFLLDRWRPEEELISLRLLAILMALALIIVAADLGRSLKILDGK